MANKNVKLKDTSTGDYLFPLTLASNTADISVVTVSADTASSCDITGNGNAGKSLIIIYTNTAAGAVDRTIGIPSSVLCPDGTTDGSATITCPAGGYCEVNYLNIGGTVYARFL